MAGAEAVLGTAAVAIRSTDAGLEADIKAKVDAASKKVKASVPVAADTKSAESAFTNLANMAKGKLDSIAGSNNLVSRGLKTIGDVGIDTSTILSGALAGGIVAVAGALATLAVKGIAEFQKAAGEVRSLKSAMGSTAEEASNLRNVGVALGTSTDVLVKGLNKLSVNLNTTSGDFANSHVEIQRNADGTANLYGTFMNLRTAYQAIKDPQEKTIFLQEAMAKGGVQLKTVLSATNEEFDKFAKRGPIFSDKDLTASRDLAIAQREMGTAVKTLEIDLARGLIPTLAGLAKGVAQGIESVDRAAKSQGVFGQSVRAVAHDVQSWLVGSEVAYLKHQKALTDTGSAAEELRAKFDAQAASLKEAGVEVSAAELKIGELSETNKKAAAEAEKHAAAVDQLAAQVTVAYLATGGAAESLSEEQHDLAKSFDSSKTAAAQLKSGLDILTGAHVSAQQAAINYESQVDDLTKTLGENGATLDITTEKGRENYKGILDLITGSGNVAVAMRNQGKSQEEVTATYAAHIAEMRSILTQAGFTEAQIQSLIDKYNLLAKAPNIEKYVDTYVTTHYGATQANNSNLGSAGDPYYGQERGGRLGYPDGPPPDRAARGMKTKGPTLVGEGNPRYPEYVIATDPAYRNRNLPFLREAAAAMSDGDSYGAGGGGATLNATIVGSDPATVVTMAMAALNWAAGS